MCGAPSAGQMNALYKSMLLTNGFGLCIATGLTHGFLCATKSIAAFKSKSPLLTQYSEQQQTHEDVERLFIWLIIWPHPHALHWLCSTRYCLFILSFPFSSLRLNAGSVLADLMIIAMTSCGVNVGSRPINKAAPPVT